MNIFGSEVPLYVVIAGAFVTLAVMLRSFLSSITLYMVIAGILVATAVIITGHLQVAANDRRWMLAAASIPGLGFLCLFYSLAIHMYRSLGGWPTVIGNRGFSSELLRHAEITQFYFGIILLFSTFGWPILFLLCVAIRQLRPFVPVATAYAIACYLSFVGILCAPGRFLNWWWD